MAKFKPYRARPVQFLKLWEHGKWKIKIYAIIEHNQHWQDRFILEAKRIAKKELDQLTTKEAHHHFAFMTIHAAQMFHQITLDWWARENELRHLVFKANPDAPLSFSNITCSGEAFCVWELEIIGHERQAWLKHVLGKSELPDFDAYSSATMNVVP